MKKAVIIIIFLLFIGIVGVGVWKFDNIARLLGIDIRVNGSSTEQPNTKPNEDKEVDMSRLASGLYNEYAIMTKSWQELKEEGFFAVDNGVLTNNFKSLDTTNLEDIKLKGTLVVDDEVTEIGDKAFYAERQEYITKGITLIDLPQTVTSIGNYAFGACNFKNIDIPSSVTTIGKYAFSNCVELNLVTGMKGIKKISKGMFASTGFIKISLPKNISSLEFRAFDYCSKLETVEILAEKISIKGNEVFAGCNLLKDFDFSKLTGSIYERSFSGCSSLTEVVLPEGVTGIGRYAFENCTKLKKVKLPNTLTYGIGPKAFTNCALLKNVYIPETCYNIESSTDSPFDENAITVYFQATEDNIKGSVTYFKNYNSAKFGYTYEQYLAVITKFD